MTRKQALGRGLAALLPGEDVPRGTPLQQIDIEKLVTGRFQPRRDFSAEALQELAESIRSHGVVQPIVAVPRGGDTYEVVAGERRLRAARLAGLSSVPVVLREKPSDRELLEIALIENLQREDLNPIEEAEAYARLREEFSLSQEQIATRVSKDRTTVANILRLLTLTHSIRDRIRAGELTAGHGRALAALATPGEQEALADEVVRRGLSVRQTEARVASITRGMRLRREKKRDPFTRDAEEKLSRRLQARVRIVRRRRGGRIEIGFGSEEELIGLFDRLAGKA